MNRVEVRKKERGGYVVRGSFLYAAGLSRARIISSLVKLLQKAEAPVSTLIRAGPGPRDCPCWQFHMHVTLLARLYVKRSVILDYKLTNC